MGCGKHSPFKGVSTVNPTQRWPDSAHHCWLAVKKDGTMVSTHCTRMAGLYGQVKSPALTAAASLGYEGTGEIPYLLT